MSYSTPESLEKCYRQMPVISLEAELDRVNDRIEELTMKREVLIKCIGEKALDD